MDPLNLTNAHRGKVLAVHKRDGAAHFAATDPHFRACCEAVDIPPTKRQARRWRQGKGLARTEGPAALKAAQEADAEA